MTELTSLPNPAGLPSAVTEQSYNTTTHVFDTWDVFIHPHWYQFGPISDTWHYAIGIYITIVGITGIIGNSVVIYTFSTTRNLKTPSNMFIVNLALSDLIFSAVNGFPLLTISAFNKRWMWGSVACTLYGFIGGLFGLMSINTLAAISFDRYLAISRPLQSAKNMTKRKAFMMIICVWIWSLVWAVPPIFGWGGYIPEGFQTSCTFDYLTTTPFMRSYIFCLYICGFVVPLLAIFACYALIIRAINKHEKEMLKMAKKMKVDDIKANQEKQNNEIKIAKIAMMLIGLFLLSWCPYATVALIGQFGPTEWVTPFMSELPVMLAKASAMHNPIVYALNHPKFREALFAKAPWIFCCCDPPKSTTSPSASQARSKHSKVSRAVSGDSDVVGGNFSDMSSCVSNLSDSAYGASVEMKKMKHNETSFNKRSDNDGASGYDNVLVRDLIQALVGVASAQSRSPSVIQPVYLPSGAPAGEHSNQAAGERQGVYVVDNGKQVDITTYLAQLAAAGGIACATSKNNEESTQEDKTEVDKKEAPSKDNQAKENKEGGKDNPALVGDPNV